MPNKYHPFDSRLEHRAPGSSAVTASEVVNTITQLAAGRTDYMTKIYVEAVDIATSDELYLFVIELSDNDFGNVREVAAIRDFGDTAVRQSGAPDTVAGDEIEIFWSTEVNGVVYRYWRLNLIITPTSTESITFHAYSAPME